MATFHHLDSKSINTLTKLKPYLDPKDNFSAYRQALRKSTGPCVPLLGKCIAARSLLSAEYHEAVHIHDLRATMAQSHDQFDDMGTAMVNFEKWRRFHSAAHEFLHHKPPDMSQYRQSGFFAYVQNQLRGIAIGSAADRDFERRSKELVEAEQKPHKRHLVDLDYLGIR